MTDELLPALPPLTCDETTGHAAVWTADQMRAYAREAIRLSHTWPTLRDDAALPGGGVDDAMVNRAARALCRRQADECNVDYDDTWKVYGDSFIDDAIAALTAAFTPTPNPHEADRNG